MKKASLAVASVLALIVTVFAQSTGQRRVGWANTVTELLSLTPSKEAYVYVTKGNLYSTNLDGKILAYDPSSTATVNNTNVWAPDSGIGRWLLISTLNGSGGGGGGAITLTVPDGFGVTGSPLTPPGTLGITSTLTNLAKGTGSGFSNAVASVDYVPPGPIGSSGLTMTGTNLLGRYSSGSGAIQSISVSNGLSFYASQLLGPLNPTDTYIPKRSGSGAFADSPFRIDSTATTYVYTNVDQFEFRNNGAIHIGKDTLTNIVNVYQGTNILFYAFRDINNQGSPFPLVLLSEKDTTNTATSSLDGRIDSTGLGLTRDTNGIQNSIYIRPEYIELNTASASQLSIHGHPDWTSFATAPFFFNSMESTVTSSNLFQLQHVGTNVFLVRGNSGWTGTGTNQLSDDGTFKPSGASVNPTSGYVPYNNAGTFGDSPLERSGATSLLIHNESSGTSQFLFDSGNSTLIQDGAILIQKNNVAGSNPSSSLGFIANNSYVASDTTQQNSPSVTWSGQGWGTNSATSQGVLFGSYVIPSAGADAPTGLWVLQAGISNATPTTQMAVRSSSGYSGTGTNFLSDDGTYKAVSGSGGTTINPTDGYVPYRTSSTTFGNSPWYRISTNSLGFNSTNYWLSSTASGVFIGDSVASTSVSGANNVLIGYLLAANLSTGSRNVILGANNASTLQSGIQNVIIGYNSDVSSSAVSRSVLIGNGTSSEVDSGVAIGTNAKNPGVNTGVSIGSGANSSGSGGSGANVAIGGNSLAGGTTASQTVAVGYGSLTSIQAKDNAVAMGYQAGFYSTDATLGVAIGYQAGIDATNIVQSVIIGGRPLRANSRTARTVMDSVIIGHKPDAYTNDVASITNSIYIGSGLLPTTNNVAQIGTNGVFVLYLNGDVGWFRGTGAPTSHASGLVTNAPVGSMYSRLDGGMNSSFYVVETSAGNWVAK